MEGLLLFLTGNGRGSYYFFQVMLSLHTEGVQQAFSHTLPAAPYVGHTLSSAPPPTDDELSQASASFSQSEVTVWKKINFNDSD